MNADDYAEILKRAEELDQRRQKQIAQQVGAITDFQSFLEAKDLTDEFIIWKSRK